MEIQRNTFFVPHVSRIRTSVWEAEQLTLKVCCLLAPSHTAASAIALKAGRLKRVFVPVWQYDTICNYSPTASSFPTDPQQQQHQNKRRFCRISKHKTFIKVESKYIYSAKETSKQQKGTMCPSLGQAKTKIKQKNLTHTQRLRNTYKD